MNYGVTYRGWVMTFAQFISEADADEYAAYLNKKAKEVGSGERYLVVNLDD